MEKKLKTNFTEEEIVEYINELNNAIGSKRKINELLNVEHLPVFVAYLRRIGIDKDLESSAGAVELIRLKIKEVLSNPKLKYAAFKDDGFEFEYGKRNSVKEKIGLDDENVFRLGNESYFVKDGKNIILKRDDVNANNRFIDKSGRVDEKVNFWGRNYYVEEVEIKDGIRYCVTKRINGFGNKEEKTVIDTGRPVFSDDNNSSFETNYNVYSELFPLYKEWLDEEFLNGRDLEDVVRDVDTIYYKDRLYRLGMKKLSTLICIEDEKKEYESNRRKLKNLINFLENYECETEEGKNKINEFLKLAEETEVIDVEVDNEYLKEQRKNSIDYYSDLEFEELKEKTKNSEGDVNALEDILEKYRNANGKMKEVIGKIREKIMEIRDKEDINNLLKRDLEEEEVEY